MQAQLHHKQGEGNRDKAREPELAASSSRGVFRRRTFEAALGAAAKMDARAVVLEELKTGRNSDKLANALSLLTTLE